MKKVNLLLVFVFFVTVWFFSTAISLACTNGSWKCDDGKLYKCKCTSTMFGTCILYDWSFQDDCLYGYCKSSTSCAECKKGDLWCSSGDRKYCSDGKIKTTDCTWGCSSGLCKCYYGGGTYSDGSDICIGSTYKVCKNGSWSNSTCIDGCDAAGNKCKINGVCGSANNKTRSSKPTSGLCSRGTATSVDSNYQLPVWDWKCVGSSNGGTTADCKAYKTCGRMAVEYNMKKGECIYEPGACVNVYGGDTVGSQDCAGAYRSDCCIYNNYRLECDPVDQTGCGTCEECVSDGPGIAHCEANWNDGTDGQCADLKSGYCSYSLIPKCKSGSVVDGDKVASDGTYNWTCVGQSKSTSLCRTAGSSDSCSVPKSSPTVSECGIATGKFYTAQNDLLPSIADLCANDNVYDVDCPTCDMDGDDGTLNWTCTGDCNTPINCSAVNDAPPTFDSIAVQNETGTLVNVDVSGRNQICQAGFNQSDIARFVVTATDVNGVSDIGDAILRFVSTTDSGKYTTTGVGATNGTGVITFIVDTSEIPTDTYSVYVQISDADSTAGNGGWVDTGRDFRIWDCLVGVSGTFYDGSGQTISCSAGSGYSNLIPSESTFSMAYYIGTSAPRNMNVTSPNFASGDKLYWNTSVAYQPVFTDFPGADPTEMRINGSTCVSGISLDPKAYVDPYVDNPSMTIDYSSVLDQDAWFSVTSGSVISKAKISNYIPVTCNTENCQTSVGGVVWSKGRSTLSTYDQVSNQRRMNEKSLELKDVSYRYFFDNYFSKLGIGVTVGSSKNWSEIASLTGILLIKGNLLIDQNITGTEMRVIGVSGDITIDPSVKQINAVLFGRNVSVGGTSSDQLQINGSIYSSGSVTLNRSFTDKSKNNITPAVKVNYDPSILFKMPKEVSKSVTQWRMN